MGHRARLADPGHFPFTAARIRQCTGQAGLRRYAYASAPNRMPDIGICSTGTDRFVGVSISTQMGYDSDILWRSRIGKLVISTPRRYGAAPPGYTAR
jgi:hypothetical protein